MGLLYTHWSLRMARERGEKGGSAADTEAAEAQGLKETSPDPAGVPLFGVCSPDSSKISC